MATFLTRDAILTADDEQLRIVEVPEWGGNVRVRGLSGTERGLFEQTCNEEVPAGNRAQRRAGQTVNKTKTEIIMPTLCAWCIVDESGERLFTDDDVAALGAKSGKALDRVFDVATQLSGLSDDDVDSLAEKMMRNPSSNSSTA